jgi:hypothetical protein
MKDSFAGYSNLDFFVVFFQGLKYIFSVSVEKCVVILVILPFYVTWCFLLQLLIFFPCSVYSMF